MTKLITKSITKSMTKSMIGSVTALANCHHVTRRLYITSSGISVLLVSFL